jgi:hypothetical protein
MAKFKPARGKKPAATPRPNAIGCIIVIALLFVLLFVMMYYTVKSG